MIDRSIDRRCTRNIVAVSCYQVSKGCRAGAAWPSRDTVVSVWEDFKGAVETINTFIEGGEKVKVVLFHPINRLQPEQQETKERKKMGGRARKKKTNIWFTFPNGKVSCPAVEEH